MLPVCSLALGTMMSFVLRRGGRCRKGVGGTEKGRVTATLVSPNAYGPPRRPEPAGGSGWSVIDGGIHVRMAVDHGHCLTAGEGEASGDVMRVISGVGE